ncbi:MAG: TetR family transcriptional regulator [Pseudomonadota bacterium]
MSAKRLSRRDAVLDAAISTLAANPNASLAEIAAAAGIGRATLHRYFGSRHGLLNEVARRALRDVDEAAAGIPYDDLSPAQMLQAVLEAVIPLGDRYYFLSTMAPSHDPEIVAASERQSRELADMVEALKAGGVFASDVPTRWAATTLDAMIWAGWAAVGKGDVARNDVVDLAYRTIVLGLGRNQ